MDRMTTIFINHTKTEKWNLKSLSQNTTYIQDLASQNHEVMLNCRSPKWNTTNTKSKIADNNYQDILSIRNFCKTTYIFMLGQSLWLFGNICNYSTYAWCYFKSSRSLGLLMISLSSKLYNLVAINIGEIYCRFCFLVDKMCNILHMHSYKVWKELDGLVTWYI